MSTGRSRRSMAASASSSSARFRTVRPWPPRAVATGPRSGHCERGDRRVHVLVAQLDVFGAVRPVVEDHDHEVDAVPDRRAELREPAEHEPAVAGDEQHRPPGRAEGRADGVAHAEPDRAEVHRVHVGRGLRHVQPPEGVEDEAPAIEDECAVPGERLDSNRASTTRMSTVDSVLRSLKLLVRPSRKPLGELGRREAGRLDLGLVEPVDECVGDTQPRRRRRPRGRWCAEPRPAGRCRRGRPSCRPPAIPRRSSTCSARHRTR